MPRRTVSSSPAIPAWTPSTKPIGKGTGLGLSVSYGIIQEHAGRIEVESEPGEGAMFLITLPVLSDAYAEVPPAHAMEEAHLIIR